METESAPSPSDFYVPQDIPQVIFQVFSQEVQEKSPEVNEQVPEVSEPVVKKDPEKPKQFYSG